MRDFFTALVVMFSVTVILTGVALAVANFPTACNLDGVAVASFCSLVLLVSSPVFGLVIYEAVSMRNWADVERQIKAYRK